MLISYTFMYPLSLVNQHDISLIEILKSETVFQDVLSRIASNESLIKLLLERTTTLQVSDVLYFRVQ